MSDEKWLEDPSRNVPGEFVTPRVETLPGNRLPKSSFRVRTRATPHAQAHEVHGVDDEVLVLAVLPSWVRRLTVATYALASISFALVGIQLLRLAHEVNPEGGVSNRTLVAEIHEVAQLLGIGAGSLWVIAAFATWWWTARLLRSAGTSGWIDPPGKPWRSALWWFVPLANWAKPFLLLERASWFRTVSGLSGWRGMFVGVSVAGALLVPAGLVTAPDPGSASGTTQLVGGVLLAVSVMMAGATMFARFAMREIDTLARVHRPPAGSGPRLPAAVWAPKHPATPPE